jgi:hypothetical protein
LTAEPYSNQDEESFEDMQAEAETDAEEQRLSGSRRLFFAVAADDDKEEAGERDGRLLVLDGGVGRLYRRFGSCSRWSLWAIEHYSVI